MPVFLVDGDPDRHTRVSRSRPVCWPWRHTGTGRDTVARPERITTGISQPFIGRRTRRPQARAWVSRRRREQRGVEPMLAPQSPAGPSRAMAVLHSSCRPHGVLDAGRHVHRLGKGRDIPDVQHALVLQVVLGGVGWGFPSRTSRPLHIDDIGVVVGHMDHGPVSVAGQPVSRMSSIRGGRAVDADLRPVQIVPDGGGVRLRHMGDDLGFLHPATMPGDGRRKARRPRYWAPPRT